MAAPKRIKTTNLRDPILAECARCGEAVDPFAGHTCTKAPLPIVAECDRLRSDRARLIEALKDIITFHRVFWKHPGIDRAGTEWRGCRFCTGEWKLGGKAQHKINCVGQVASALLRELGEDV